jgi:Leucine-rich repeat (LRR) protein
MNNMKLLKYLHERNKFSRLLAPVIGGFLLLSQPAWGSQPFPLTELPSEVQEKIINFSEIKDLLNLAKVNKAYYDSVNKLVGGRTVFIKPVQLNDDTVESLKHVGDLRIRFDATANDETLRLVGKLTNLKELVLFDTKITDAGLVHLENLKDLQVLYLGRTSISNAGLVHLKGLKNLKILSLPQPASNDAGIVDLMDLKNLEVLYLRNDWTTPLKVTDAGLMHLKGLNKLKSLVLYNMRLTPGAIDELKKAIPGLEVKLLTI